MKGARFWRRVGNSNGFGVMVRAVVVVKEVVVEV